MTTTDEEIMQAAREIAGTVCRKIGWVEFGERLRRGEDDNSSYVQIAIAAIRSERARTQATAAAAWVVGRDAATAQLQQTHDIIECAHAVNPLTSRKQDMDLLDEQIDAISALTPPAEFAAPSWDRECVKCGTKWSGAGLCPKCEISAAQEDPRDMPPIEFTYRNWRGEIGQRRAIPIRIHFGATEWHPELQWLMSAFDLDKGAVRDFAIKDMSFATADPRDAKVWGDMTDAERAEVINNGQPEDPRDVEITRLREANAHLTDEITQAVEDVSRLRAQLAERDALLREAQDILERMQEDNPSLWLIKCNAAPVSACIDALLKMEGE